MGILSRLFGMKDAVAESSLPPHLKEALSVPPRLIVEGPKFPDGPVVLVRTVTPEQIEAALANAGFVDGVRGETKAAHRFENGVLLLDVTGADQAAAKEELLAVLPWVNSREGFYERLRAKDTPVEDLRYLTAALRHYDCVGGVPMELRMNPDEQIRETIRLMERDAMARAARAKRR